jgi:hypothetical protein
MVFREATEAELRLTRFGVTFSSLLVFGATASESFVYVCAHSCG